MGKRDFSLSGRTGKKGVEGKSVVSRKERVLPGEGGVSMSLGVEIQDTRTEREGARLPPVTRGTSHQLPKMGGGGILLSRKKGSGQRGNRKHGKEKGSFPDSK